MSSIKETISLMGCGWFGMELAKNLIAEGYTVKGSTTTPGKLEEIQQLGVIPYIVSFQEAEESFEADFFNCDTLLVNIPPKRSTAEQPTYIKKVERILNAVVHYKVKNVIFISSTSVYGDTQGEVTEETEPHPDTASGTAILAAELLLKKQIEFDTTIIRFGGLIGPGRDPGRFFAGKMDIPNGNAPVNLIHLSDCVGLTLMILKQKAFGQLYNACAPQHPSRKEFYTLASQKSGLDTPVFKDELINWKLVYSTTIKKHLGYQFVMSL